jgi:hypothetical protein
MDKGRLLAALRELPGRYVTRVRQEDIAGLQSMAQAGEWRELVDLLVASLAYNHASISEEEASALRSYLQDLDIQESAIDQITICG